MVEQRKVHCMPTKRLQSLPLCLQPLAAEANRSAPSCSASSPSPHLFSLALLVSLVIHSRLFL